MPIHLVLQMMDKTTILTLVQVQTVHFEVFDDALDVLRFDFHFAVSASEVGLVAMQRHEVVLEIGLLGAEVGTPLGATHEPTMSRDEFRVSFFFFFFI